MKLTCVTAVMNAIKSGNRERLIRCVRSVAALKTEHEHLIYDGGSTDGTVELLRELEREINQKVGGESRWTADGLSADSDAIGTIASTGGGESGALVERALPAGVDRRACAERKVAEWLAGVDGAAFEAALVKLVDEKTAAGVTFTASHKEKKLPRLVPLTEAVRTVVHYQTATGSYPSNEGSISNPCGDDKGGGGEASKSKVEVEERTGLRSSVDAFVPNASDGVGHSSTDAIETIASTGGGESGALIERAMPEIDNSTVDLLSRPTFSHPRLRVVSEPDTGIYNALNKGVRDAKGEWFYALFAKIHQSAKRIAYRKEPFAAYSTDGFSSSHCAPFSDEAMSVAQSLLNLTDGDIRSIQKKHYFPLKPILPLLSHPDATLRRAALYLLLRNLFGCLGCFKSPVDAKSVRVTPATSSHHRLGGAPAADPASTPDFFSHIPLPLCP